MSVTCSFIKLSPVPGSQAPNNTIEIWHGIATDFYGLYDGLYHLLHKEEQAAAARYRRKPDREGYIIRHGILRLLLSRRLNIPAVDLDFRFNPNKKPYLKAKSEPVCFFNLSHSAGEFLIAIGDDELGIDIEQINFGFAWQDIAAQYFGEAERKYINTSAQPAKAFFLLWTRKEALLKACGMGVDDNLPEVPALDGPHSLPSYYPAKDWQTESFLIGDGFMGSITYTSPHKKVVLMPLNLDVAQALR